MKTLSRTFVFIVAAVVAVVAVLGLGALGAASGQPTNRNYKFKVTIGGPGQDDYVDLRKNQQGTPLQKEFNDALNALKGNHGDANIRFLCRAGGTAQDPYDPANPQLCIKTDKVTTSEVAKNGPAGEAVANDPNVTRYLKSDSVTDIKAVLDTFQ